MRLNESNVSLIDLILNEKIKITVLIQKRNEENKNKKSIFTHH